MTILRTSGRLIVSNEAQRNAGVAQWLERHVANVNVVGSNPITRSLSYFFSLLVREMILADINRCRFAAVIQPDLNLFAAVAFPM